MKNFGLDGRGLVRGGLIERGAKKIFHGKWILTVIFGGFGKAIKQTAENKEYVPETILFTDFFL